MYHCLASGYSGFPASSFPGSLEQKQRGAPGNSAEHYLSTDYRSTVSIRCLRLAGRNVPSPSQLPTYKAKQRTVPLPANSS